MARTRKSTTTSKRTSPKTRPDPSGIDAPASTLLGKLRKILMLIIYHHFSSQFKSFILHYNLEEYENFIKNQCSHYKNNQTWDPVVSKSNDQTQRPSRVRKVIIDVYNEMPFPRHLSDLQQKLISLGHDLRPTRIMLYLNQMGVFCSNISRCLNPTRIDTCKERKTRAIEMVKEVKELKQQHLADPTNENLNWYYYDQSPFQQLGKKRDIVLGPKGLKIYDPSRVTLKGPALTLHMIVDQKGELIEQLWASGGQDEAAIRSFLTKAVARTPAGIRPIVYCDHLATHKKLSKEKNFCWDVRLLPVSSSDANIIEYKFSTLKSYLYKQLQGQERMKKIDELITWCTTKTLEWWNRYQADLKLLNHSMKFLSLLIKAKGNLQTVSLLKNGYKNLNDLIIKPLDVDAELE